MNAENPQAESPRILKEIEYWEQDKISMLPLLEKYPLKHGFTWGKMSENMSPVYAKEEGAETVEARIVNFLKSCNMEGKRINALGVFEGTHMQIMEVSQKDTEDIPETPVKANFIYTKDRKVILSIRPGDCNVSIIFAKDKEGRSIAGLIHSSAHSTNMGLPRYAIRHLIEDEGVEQSSIIVGITPGISKEHYSISCEADVLNNPNLDKVTVERNWKGHISSKDLSKGDSRPRQVDILGATIMQFEEEGVLPQNIQVYEIDTYDAAEKGEGFSKRYSDDSGKPQARIMVAVQLA